MMELSDIVYAAASYVTQGNRKPRAEDTPDWNSDIFRLEKLVADIRTEIGWIDNEKGQQENRSKLTSNQVKLRMLLNGHAGSLEPTVLTMRCVDSF